MSYQPYNDIYGNDGRGRWQNSRAQDVAREDVDAVKQRQWDAYYRPAAPRYDHSGRSELSEQNLQEYNRGATQGRRQSAPDGYDTSRTQRRRRRYSDSRSSEASNEQRDQKDDGQQQGLSKRDYFRLNPRQKQTQSQPYDGDLSSLANSNFDLSGNGVFAAALGAGVGAIIARRVDDYRHPGGDGSHEGWKTLGGAVVGAALANAGKKQYSKRFNEGGEGEKSG